MIKISGLTVKEFCKQYKLAESSIYAAYRKNGEQGALDLLIKVKSRIDREPTQKEVLNYYKGYRERLDRLEKEAKETKAKLLKELAVYQSLTVILAIVLIIVFGF